MTAECCLLSCSPKRELITSMDMEQSSGTFLLRRDAHSASILNDDRT